MITQPDDDRTATTDEEIEQPKPVPARVDLADYRRRSYEAASARLRWRYENGLSIPDVD